MMHVRLAQRWLAARGQDMANAQLAREIYDGLIEYLRGSPDIKFNYSTQNAVVEASDFGDGPLYQRLTFLVGVGSGIYYDASRQVVFVGVPVLDPSSGEAQAKRTLLSVPLRSPLLHELTHHVDARRMRGGWGKAEKNYVDPKEDPEGYFNHPLEMNAYFQQGVASYTSDWKDILKDFTPDDPNEDAHAVALMNMMDMEKLSWREFLASVLRVLPSQFWGYLTQENKRRFTKRVYDLYDEIVGGSQRRLRDLRRKHDPIMKDLDGNG